jgi:hypothetical protein
MYTKYREPVLLITLNLMCTKLFIFYLSIVFIEAKAKYVELQSINRGITREQAAACERRLFTKRKERKVYISARKKV